MFKSSKGFEMGMKLTEEQTLYSDLDENFDPLQYDAREIADMKNRQNCDISLTNTTSSKNDKGDDYKKRVKDNVDPCDEEDEEEDDFVQKGK